MVKATGKKKPRKRRKPGAATAARKPRKPRKRRKPGAATAARKPRKPRKRRKFGAATAASAASKARTASRARKKGARPKARKKGARPKARKKGARPKARKTWPTRTIRQVVKLAALPEAVYLALVDARKHATFTGFGASGLARVGALFTAGSGYIRGRHLDLVPGRRIVQEWSTADFPEGHPPSRLVLNLRRVGKGTRLTMVHSQVPASQASAYRKGWNTHYWEPLRLYLVKR